MMGKTQHLKGIHEIFTFSRVGFVLFSASHASLLIAQTSDGSSWYRDIAISPAGDQIAFTYSGQVWVANAKGGDAVPLTSETVYSSNPVWSPDGQSLAYQSNQYGRGDVFVLNMNTHKSQRLTFHGSKDIPYSLVPMVAKSYFNLLGSVMVIAN